MRKVFIWLVFLLGVAVLVKAAAGWRNPWGSSNFVPRVDVSIPGCADKPECKP